MPVVPGGSKVQSHPQLYTESKASLGCLRLSMAKKPNRQETKSLLPEKQAWCGNVHTAESLQLFGVVLGVDPLFQHSGQSLPRKSGHL